PRARPRERGHDRRRRRDPARGRGDPGRAMVADAADRRHDGRDRGDGVLLRAGRRRRHRQRTRRGRRARTRGGRGTAAPFVVVTTESTAQRAADSPRVQRAARWGLATRGVLYLVVGVLVVELAFGRRVEPNSQGALRAVAHQPLGTALLALVAVGLAAHACWQGLLAVAGPDGAGDARRAAVARVANVGRALLYAALAVIAIQLVAGANPTASSTREQEDWTGHVLRWPGGRALVVMSIPMRRVVSALAKAGIAARGVVAALVGVFVVEAAVRFDPADSSGID